MCGRYVAATGAQRLGVLFDAEVSADLPAPSWNVAPTDAVPVVVELAEETARRRVVTGARWGFPRRSGGVAVNARLESPATVSELRRRRCLVPADGWYEWSGAAQQRRPHFITGPDVLALAALWRRDEAGLRVVILTGAAAGPLAQLHHRTPMLVLPAAWDAWLQGDDGTAGTELLTPATSVASEVRAVDPAVNKVGNNGPHLVEPVAPPPALF